MSALERTEELRCVVEEMGEAGSLKCGRPLKEPPASEAKRKVAALASAHSSPWSWPSGGRHQFRVDLPRAPSRLSDAWSSSVLWVTKARLV
jgi:hypothetical protein